MFFSLIIISMDRSLQKQAATGPGINTLYVPIGKLHPRSEYVGVLINLNVAAALPLEFLSSQAINKTRQNL